MVALASPAARTPTPVAAAAAAVAAVAELAVTAELAATTAAVLAAQPEPAHLLVLPAAQERPPRE
jgi:hypothetical protein